MASEKMAAQDKYGVGYVAGGSNHGGPEAEATPFIKMDAALYVPDADGKPVLKETAHMPHNLVVHQGRALVLNRLFGSWTSYSQGALLFLHSASATTNTSAIWGDIAGSQVTGYGASIPAITFSTANTASNATGQQTFTASASYGITAVQTVSGAGIVFYTSASGATNLASSDARLYCFGTFNSLQAANPSTLSVTVTVSMA